MSDAISNLPTLQWRGIRVPYDELKTDVAHDQRDHEYDLVDGARVEPKGRKARVISCRVILGNTSVAMLPWKYDRPWFPDVFLEFVRAMDDRSAGTLVHPTRGEMLCVPLTSSDTLHSQMRDGEIVQCAWKETNDEPSLADAPNLDALSLVTVSAQSLDAQLAALQPPLPPAQMPSASFESMCNSIIATADTASLVVQQATGSVTNVIAQANRVSDALSRDTSTAGASIRISAQRLASALNEVAAKSRSARAATFAVYNVLEAMTLGRIATILARGVDELLQLNPGLASSRLVQPGASVRYYA